MAFDAHTNFAYSTVATAPSPALSGGSLTLAAGDGLLMPAAPFQMVLWPAGVQPLASNAEIVRVTKVTSDACLITRAQELTTAKAVAVGWQASAAITAKMFTDIETSIGGGLVDGGNFSTNHAGNLRIDFGSFT